MASVVGFDRRAKHRAIGREVVSRDQSPVLLHRSDDPFGDLARVEGRRAVRFDLLQRPAEIALNEALSGGVGRSVGLQKRPSPRLVGLPTGTRPGEALGLVPRQDHALLGETPSRRHDLGPRQAPPAPVRRLQTGDRAGHARSAIAAAQVARISALRRRVEPHVGRLRRYRAIVQRHRLIGGGDMDEHIAVAAEIAGARQGDGQGEARRHGRVDGVAAPAQDVGAHLTGDGVLADHHRAVGMNRVLDGGVVQQRRTRRRRLTKSLRGAGRQEQRGEEGVGPGARARHGRPPVIRRAWPCRRPCPVRPPNGRRRRRPTGRTCSSARCEACPTGGQRAG
ncbi:hypothetical protein D3C77_254370 [compost metagenome]